MANVFPSFFVSMLYAVGDLWLCFLQNQFVIDLVIGLFCMFLFLYCINLLKRFLYV